MSEEFVVYEEPVTGLNEYRNETICNKHILITVEDAIKIQRFKMDNMPYTISKEDLLEIFLVNNGGWVEEH